MMLIQDTTADPPSQLKMQSHKEAKPARMLGVHSTTSVPGLMAGESTGSTHLEKCRVDGGCRTQGDGRGDGDYRPRRRRLEARLQARLRARLRARLGAGGTGLGAGVGAIVPILAVGSVFTVVSVRGDVFASLQTEDVSQVAPEALE